MAALANAMYRQANLRLSKRISIFLAGGFLLLAGVVGATSYWMATEHDKLAAESTRRMVGGGLRALEEKLETLIMDYSRWTEAYEAILKKDIEWLYPNSGSSTDGSGPMDLNMVVEPGGATNFGWIVGGGEEPQPDLLDAETMKMVQTLLDDYPLKEMGALSTYAVSNGELWLLSTGRVTLSNGLPEGATDETLPRHIFGIRITDKVISEIGAQIFVDDITLSAEPVPGRDGVALIAASGEYVAFVDWAAPRPGIDILERIAAPLIIVLLLVGAATVLATRTMVGSALRLERALVAAQAADRSKTEFLANVSHELRTPMNGVLGVAALLQNSDLDEQQAEMIDILEKSAKSQMMIIDDLLDIAQIESGSTTLDTVPFDPAQALSDVNDLLRPEADRKGLNFVVDALPNGPAKVLGDCQAFKQIATNLISNAIKFTDEGMVTVGLEMNSHADQTSVKLVVTDTGPGIDAKDHEMIFERFAQIDGSKSRAVGGSGLGLAITKSLVEMMGGTITLVSRRGEGASFTVDLRLESATEDVPAAAA